MSKNFIFIILLLILCSTSMIAQTSYYYYKGEKIPLSLNNSKLCVSIPKTKGDVSKELMKGINVLDTIKDEAFDISIIQQADFKKMSSSKVWEKEENTFLVSPCYITKDRKEVFLTPYLNVRLKREQDFNLLLSYAERYGLRIVKQNPFLPLWYILSISSVKGKNTMDIANALWESGEFAASSPDMSSCNLSYCSSDPEFNKQWGLYNGYYSGIDISVCDAWNYSTGKNVKIAILDSGIDQNHDDLRDNIIGNLSFNTITGVSPYYGFDGSHGTHCAGIAAAIKDNGYKVAGVAPEAKIIPIYNSLTFHANLSEQLANGIMWAYENGADIISNSWGLPTRSTLIDEAIQEAFKHGRNGKGCIIVFATGNDSINTNSISYPANSNDTILAVGSIDSTGVRALSSQYGAGLDLVAPGVKIWSTIPNQSGYMSGTSMACPHVAGVAALILERNPELTVTQVNSAICSNAKKLSGVTFNETKSDGTWNEEYGYGLLDAYSSVINTPRVEYIQNDTITGTQTIYSDMIYIGKDVTDRKEHGDVILGQGDITLKAKRVTIKNSTIVPLGTKLKIVNQ